MTNSYIQSSMVTEDPVFDVPLRPKTLRDFIGQETIKERLEVLIHAAQGRGEVLTHCLFSGPPGLGKTTLAHILSEAMGSKLVLISAPILEKVGDLAGLLTNLQEGDVLFIDEIHALNRTIEEYLYKAMEDFAIDIVIDSGPNARSVQLKLNRFTLCGATTRLGLLTEPFRSRFGFVSRFEYYDLISLDQILNRTAALLGVSIDSEGTLEIARRSRGTPRVANHLLRWVRDFAQIRAGNHVTPKVAQEALNLLGIDHLGLDEMDLRFLKLLSDHGGCVGLKTIAASLGEDEKTIEGLEPYLLQIGYIQRTPKGRTITLNGQRHLADRSISLESRDDNFKRKNM